MNFNREQKISHGPAKIEYNVNGKIYSEIWYKNGKNIEKMVIVLTKLNIMKNSKIEIWYNNGIIHKDNGKKLLMVLMKLNIMKFSIIMENCTIKRSPKIAHDFAIIQY